ncbi:hypothetical protein ENU1_047540 [Entamoeba nuttalli P19]|uniref:Uncharacterized protein n=1 Tax=Entamoeba nuttalli (strain P19) TaxID=1076696 RepID=K2H5N1_ENTNP|nr:hypothetical protein ENU1_047540 [Entamoeba nuttalli P19]EKE41687.1 hypothetical protein ENU1_047540 [Entamoeba nuttalli P19]|eukprot:XP_008855980.1 hypothetical protein ENU1_047540 [Entamoeba nuttalli P19]
MTTKYSVKFRGIIHISGENNSVFSGLMKSTSEFILNTMSSLNEDHKPNVPQIIKTIQDSQMVERLEKITKFSEEEIKLIQIAEDQKESLKILEKIKKDKQVIFKIYQNMNNLEQLRDYCSRVVDFVSDVSQILKNVDLWNCKGAISYIDKLRLYIKTMVEYLKANSGRKIISSELNSVRPTGDIIVNAVYNFMTSRSSTYKEEEGKVSMCALNIKMGYDNLYEFVLGKQPVEKVKEFKESLDEAERYLKKEFDFGVIVNVEKKDIAEQAIISLENAKTQEDKDKAAIQLLNGLNERALLQKDEHKKKILAKVITTKDNKKKKNYTELLQAARKLSENVDSLKEIVYQTDTATCIDTLSFSQVRDQMLGM